jgi:uncharacterized protein YqiB (DUF1249 family)
VGCCGLQVVVVRCYPDAEVAEYLACTVAAQFMANRIVLPFIDADGTPEEQQQQLKTTLGALPSWWTHWNV